MTSQAVDPGHKLNIAALAGEGVLKSEMVEIKVTSLLKDVVQGQYMEWGVCLFPRFINVFEYLI